MVRRNLTKSQIASLLKISRNTLANKLNGKTSFKVEEILKLQQIFDDSSCTFEYLLKPKKKIKI